MLEISHLHKVYKNKKGKDVHAINDVSLKFPETGMVFLLGKSGSGKTTLLNVIGGLDSPSNGEIIVKGRSSKDFSQSDFDSYRNTFIGFIFQEYNILNEFSIEDNIGLALELQNKPKDKEAINALLTKVDLEGYAKRKPNTLSGGQKQRIAIARALIKNPEIIMADEPTGALDSTTGTQVLETLKKLSKDTLVIVVSHDREFAETYGDRIIELKDGKVISDITKTNESIEQVSKNVKILGTTICIENGSQLNDNDFEEIKSFLKKTNNEVILSSGTNEIQNVKKANKINDSGLKEVFKETNHESIEIKNYTKEDSKFLKSKLPLRYAFKIGVSSLKNKPIRLFFTIMLCTIAFVMFGLLSTITFYDSESTFKESLNNSNYTLLKLTKNYEVLEKTYYEGELSYDYKSYYDTPFSKEEYEEYKKIYGNKTFYVLETYMDYAMSSTKNEYWRNIVYGIGVLEEDNPLRNEITGKYPTKDNEILISSYMANLFLNNKVVDGKTHKVINIKKIEDVIGKHLELNSKVFKITGIINSGEIDPKFEILKTESTNLANEYFMHLVDGMHLLIFTTKSGLETFKDFTYYDGPQGKEFYRGTIISFDINDDYEYESYTNSYYSEYLDEYKDKTVYLSNDKKLNDNEIILGYNSFGRIMSNKINDIIEKTYDYDLYDYQMMANYVAEKGYYDEDGYVKLSDAKVKSYIEKLFTMYKKYEKEFNISMKLTNNDGLSIIEAKEYKIIGVYFGENDNQRYMNSINYFTKDTVNELWDIQKDKLDYYSDYTTKYNPIVSDYKTIFIPFEHNEKYLNNALSIYKNNDYSKDGSGVHITSSIIENLEMADSLIEELSKVFLIAGIVLASFAIMLFSNFISVSISNKKKEIGILRAIGARGTDVFKIFFSESFVITLICLILSITATITICTILNDVLNNEIGLSIFVFGLMSYGVLILVGTLTALFATYIPVYLTARKKPVDSIRAI